MDPDKINGLVVIGFLLILFAAGGWVVSCNDREARRAIQKQHEYCEDEVGPEATLKQYKECLRVRRGE